MENKNESDPDLKSLGLKWEDFGGKKVLEIGAGIGRFARKAKEHDIDIVALERDPEMWLQEGQKLEDIIPKNVKYVKGDAENTPFPDSSFDIVISIAAPPIVSKTKEEVESIVHEAQRVLKDGGEFRFGPGSLDAEVFGGYKELFSPEEEQEFTRDQKEERMSQKTIELLKSINPNIIQIPILNPWDPAAAHYYILKKL